MVSDARRRASQAYRDRLREQGRKQVVIDLHEDTINALDAMRGPLRRGEVIDHLIAESPSSWAPDLGDRDSS